MLLSTNFILAAAAEMKPRLFELDFQLLADVVLMMIAILVLFLILSNKLFNPVRNMLEKRQNKIKDELQAAEEDMIQAAKLKEEYEAKLKDIAKEAEEIMGEARKKALVNENRIIAQAKEDATRIIERANVEAELQKKKVVDEVKQEMVAIASIMAGKVVAASIDTAIQGNLVNETLKEIGESTWLS